MSPSSSAPSARKKCGSSNFSSGERDGWQRPDGQSIRDVVRRVFGSLRPRVLRQGDDLES
jgi:hypothetical protein